MLLLVFVYYYLSFTRWCLAVGKNLKMSWPNCLFPAIVWILGPLVWGAAGIAVGPGIIMLILALFVAIAGCLISFSEKLFKFQLNLFWFGTAVCTSALLIALLIFRNLNLQSIGVLYLAIFISIPSYLVPFVMVKLGLKPLKR